MHLKNFKTLVRYKLTSDLKYDSLVDILATSSYTDFYLNAFLTVSLPGLQHAARLRMLHRRKPLT